MMTKRPNGNQRLLYNFSLEDRIPQDHLLRKIKDSVDFDFIYGLVENHYSHTGAPSVDPVVIFKLSLIGYLYNISSERRLLEEAKLNLAYLWFLDYDIDEILPDHSIMTKTRIRFGTEIFRKFFHRVVEICINAGLVEGDTAYLDATLINSKALVNDCRSKVLVDELNKKADSFVDELFSEDSLEEAGLSSEDNDDCKLDHSQKPTDKDSTEKKFNSNPKSKIPKKANERFTHPKDQDADIVRRSDNPLGLYYKGHIAVDGGESRIVTSVFVTGGAMADEHLLLKLLTEHETLAGPLKNLVADQKYGTTTNFRTLKAKDINPVIVPSIGRGPAEGYGKDKFMYNRTNDIYICPQGNILTKAKKFHRWQPYRSKKSNCSACSLKQQCTTGKERKTIMRGPNDIIFSWARDMLTAPLAKELKRRRCIWPETVFANAKEFHGLDEAKYRGRWKVEIQMLMTATAMNLKKLAKYKGLPTTQSGAKAKTAFEKYAGRLFSLSFQLNPTFN